MATVGCAGFFDFLSPKPSTPVNATSANPTPGQTSNPTTNPTPGSTTSPANPVPTPGIGLLSEIQLGYLVSNNAAGLTGSVTGPATLVSNNAAGLVSNNAAGLVSNNAAGLVSNNAAGLVSNNSSGYRLTTVADVKVAEGFVYLTTPDERMYVTAEKKLFGTLTDKDGNFSMPAPAAKDVIVNVLLSGNRRLTGLVNTTGTASASVTVNLATTLVTEYLRAKAQQFGFTMADVVSNASASATLDDITALTTTLVKRDDVLSSLKPSDLMVNNIPFLRQRYVVAFGTCPGATACDATLSDKWVQLLRLVTGKTDPVQFPDVLFRPLAVTTLGTGNTIPAGNQVLSVGVGPAGAPNEGKIYVVSSNANVTELIEVPAGGGTATSLFKKPRLGPDAWRSPGTLTVLGNGNILMMDALNQWVALIDKSQSIASEPLLDYFVYDDWTNPRPLVDLFCGTQPGECDFDADIEASVDDVALDDDGNMYLADLSQHVIWKDPAGLASDVYTPLERFAGQIGTASEEVSVPPSTSSLYFNQPAKVTYHKKSGVPYLYVADNGDHVLVRINLSDGSAKRVVGEMPPVQFKSYTSDGKKGPRKSLCYSPAEEGANADKAHLRYPQKMLFDKDDRMILADGDNRLIRLATVYDGTPKVWTIAGLPQQTNSACETVGLPPPFSNEDGEARYVSLGEVSGMAFDPQGNLILSDVRGNRVRKLWTSFLK